VDLFGKLLVFLNKQGQLRHYSDKAMLENRGFLFPASTVTFVLVMVSIYTSVYHRHVI
jgi:hypothetical protein